MKYQRFNKHEKREMRVQQVQNASMGEGVYLYLNPNNADITLPRPTKSGIRSVGPKMQFQGDNYYMQLVRQGLLRLVKEIQSPEQQRAASEPKVEEKLILDQPDTITESGKVEHVVKKTPHQQKLNENKKGQQKQPNVLINESPADGGFLIVE